MPVRSFLEMFKGFYTEILVEISFLGDVASASK